MVDETEIAPRAPVTLTEAADNILRGIVTPRTLRNCIARGELRAYKIGGRIVTTAEDIQEWMNKKRVEPTRIFKLEISPTQKYKPASDELARVRQLLIDVKAERLAKQKAERERLRQIEQRSVKSKN